MNGTDYRTGMCQFYETPCTVAGVSHNLTADNKRFITN